jgi:hypothetical protein
LTAFGTPTIDGIEESVWANSSLIHIGGNVDISADVKTMWDDNNLYVLAYVSDATPYALNPVADRNDTRYDPTNRGNAHLGEHDDSFEAWINWNNDPNASYYQTGTSPYCATHNIVDRNNVRGTNFPDFLDPERSSSAVVSDGDGYTVEIAIPWPNSVTPAERKQIGINFSVNDDSEGDGERNEYITWENDIAYWNTPVGLPTIELTKSQDPPSAVRASAILSGPATAAQGKETSYVVSLANIQNAGTVKVDFSYSENFDMLDATALGGKFSVLKTDSHNDGTATITLWAPTPGVSIVDPEEVLKLVLDAKNEGTARVSITSITAVAYVKHGAEFDDVARVAVDVADGKDAVETVVEKRYDPYDFNRDGKVDILDLTFAQIYYQTSEGDAKWALVAERGIDVNNDGTVDLADLVNILNHIYSL